MLQTLTPSTNNAYFNPKKKVLSKWCANNNVMSASTAMTTTTTTTTTSSMKGNGCTLVDSYNTISSTPPVVQMPNNSPVPHLLQSNNSVASSSINSQYLANLSSWNIVQVNNTYFQKNNLKLSVDVSLTYSREDRSCLETNEVGKKGNIVLYSSLRYQLKHSLKLSPFVNLQTATHLPPLLFMKVTLEGGTTKDDIGGVISPNEELSNPSERVFSSESRVQIEKVQSYKQLVHFKIMLYDLSDLHNAICELTSVEFNVFARKKQQDGSISPKPKKTKNHSTKRASIDIGSSLKSTKQRKLAMETSFSTCNVSYTSNIMTCVDMNANNNSIDCITDNSNSNSSIASYINYVTNQQQQQEDNNDDDEDEDFALKIDDGEEPPIEQVPKSHSSEHVLFSQYETLLKELVATIKGMNNQERSFALNTAVVALR